MGLGNLKSETRVGNEMIDSTTMLTDQYIKAHEIETQPKEVDAGLGLAGAKMVHQKIEKFQPAKPNPKVPKRGSLKQAAKEVQEANKKDLKNKGIKTETD